MSPSCAHALWISQQSWLTASPGTIFTLAQKRSSSLSTRHTAAAVVRATTRASETAQYPRTWPGMACHRAKHEWPPETVMSPKEGHRGGLSPALTAVGFPGPDVGLTACGTPLPSPAAGKSGRV